MYKIGSELNDQLSRIIAFKLCEPKTPELAKGVGCGHSQQTLLQSEARPLIVSQNWDMS